VTKDILPVTTNRDDFYVLSESWAKFHSTHLSIGFKDFWAIKLRSYEKLILARKPSLQNLNAIPLGGQRSLLIVRFIAKSEGLRTAHPCFIPLQKA
jgi:hypothetical protein